MIQDPLSLTAVIAAATGFAFWLHGQFRWASRISATLLVIILGAALSNSGLVASASPVYDIISGPLVSLAIVWLLLAVDLREVRRAGPRMLRAFALAVGATVVGALTAAAIWAGGRPLGPDRGPLSRETPTCERRIQGYPPWSRRQPSDGTGLPRQQQEIQPCTRSP